jgi:ABC-type iron transport system FetAB ATPase subunit
MPSFGYSFNFLRNQVLARLNVQETENQNCEFPNGSGKSSISKRVAYFILLNSFKCFTNVLVV